MLVPLSKPADWAASVALHVVFTLDVAAATTDTTNGASMSPMAEATATWYWDGSGTFGEPTHESGSIWNLLWSPLKNSVTKALIAKDSAPAGWSLPNLADGVKPEDVSGPLANDVGNLETWSSNK